MSKGLKTEWKNVFVYELTIIIGMKWQYLLIIVHIKRFYL